MKKVKNKAEYIKKLSNINSILTELVIQAEEEMECFKIASMLLKIKREVSKALYKLSVTEK